MNPAILLSVLAAPLFAQGKPAGVVTALLGGPTVQRSGSKSPEPAKAGGFVYDGDEVRTGPKEAIAIALAGGIELKVKENTRYVVWAEKESKGQLVRQVQLTVGTAWARLIGGKRQFHMRTPTAVAAVRGSEGEVTHQDFTTFMLFEGHGSLFNDLGETPLKGGQASTAQGGKAPTPPQPIGPGERPSWPDDLRSENQEELVQSLEKAATEPKGRALELELEREKDGKKETLKLELQFERESQPEGEKGQGPK